jgi:hypothetical protein
MAHGALIGLREVSTREVDEDEVGVIEIGSPEFCALEIDTS